MRKWKEDLENGNTQKRSTTESGNLHHMNRKGKIICFDTFLTCNEVKGVTTYGATTWLKMKALVERRKSYSAYMFNSQSQPEPEPEPMNEEVCAQCELPGYYLGEAHSCQGIVSGISVELPPIQNNCAGNSSKKDNNVISETKTERDKGVYLGVEDDDMASENDEFADIWKEMAFGLESFKDSTTHPSSNDNSRMQENDCDHSFILKDDIGYVCQVCGVIDRAIETIIEYQYAKAKRTTRCRYDEAQRDNVNAKTTIVGLESSRHDIIFEDLFVHPRHAKQMKPHQVEGFNFLVSNLMTKNPGGCILAHAPGSGKTFMIICFLQSFMAKYPDARPLIVLPKGILTTWKKEFSTWQVENLALFDFYSSKAESRSQQLQVLKNWAGQKSILFLGYKQFSSIVCDCEKNEAATVCQEILLTHPSILIMDEGHTPRNENTDVLMSLRRVQTPRKVVLSGTLYQNHVREVFNIIDLVRPKFLKSDFSRGLMRRILSRIPRERNLTKNGFENAFCESVEFLIKNKECLKIKGIVIQDLRELTEKILHYYKGDFLDELPGLLDFTLFLKLSQKQKTELDILKKSAGKFAISSFGSSLYVHPKLKALKCKEKDDLNDEKIDHILQEIDLRDGVKAMFFLTLLGLCESADEKLLVFSQFLPPLKFLERLAIMEKGWSVGKQIFGITGDSTYEMREFSMERFNSSAEARVFFGSIKACGEGISLVGASRVIVLDVHLNPSVMRQAIGRAFRPGQKKKVFVYRLIAKDSPEEEDHATCFRKEAIAKMWFEWMECDNQPHFEMERLQVSDCGDTFLELSKLNEDVEELYKR